MAQKKPISAVPSSQHALALQPVYMLLALFGFGSVRELVDALVGALILALLFRAFDAEAFRIPTGSMAPTLSGRAKDLHCPQCKFHFTVGASSEDDPETGAYKGFHFDTVSVTCPLCRYMIDVDPTTSEGSKYPSFGGDRILVGKASYEFGDPQRWDIAVFKYPANASQNYIKRIVGLPNETLRIERGDMHFRAQGEQEFTIAKREPSTIKAMAQIVYDNDYVLEMLTKHNWPVRWQPLPADEARENGWVSKDGSRSYAISGDSSEETWLRYQHFTPSIDDWRRIDNGPLSKSDLPHPRLITDFYAYDTGVQRGFRPRPAEQLGLHWVGDLLLECQLEVSKPQGEVLLDLVKGGRHFRCTLDLKSGDAKLSVDGLDDFGPKAKTTLSKSGKHTLGLANFDQRFVLWVDGKPVSFDADTKYPALGNTRPRSTPEDPGDLAPAGIAARGAAVRVEHIKLWRDIYYLSGAGGSPMNDYQSPPLDPAMMDYHELLDFWSTPNLWSPASGPGPFDNLVTSEYTLEDEQFFMMGDNSPMSSDARVWPGGEHFVRRELIVGEAEILFWPHSFDKLPGTSIPFPFFPNFSRMGLIR